MTSYYRVFTNVELINQNDPKSERGEKILIIYTNLLKDILLCCGMVEKIQWQNLKTSGMLEIIFSIFFEFETDEENIFIESVNRVNIVSRIDTLIGDFDSKDKKNFSEIKRELVSIISDTVSVFDPDSVQSSQESVASIVRLKERAQFLLDQIRHVERTNLKKG